MRNNFGQFIPGHIKIGGFIPRSKHNESAKQKVADSLTGKFGVLSRNWKGTSASYAAKHMWIIKHYGNASFCENNPEHQGKRYEWANISGEYKRERSDYRQLCPSCHQKSHKGNFCKRGHEFTKENTYVTPSGWRQCKECRRTVWSKRNDK